MEIILPASGLAAATHRALKASAPQAQLRQQAAGEFWSPDKLQRNLHKQAYFGTGPSPAALQASADSFVDSVATLSQCARENVQLRWAENARFAVNGPSCTCSLHSGAQSVRINCCNTAQAMILSGYDTTMVSWCHRPRLTIVPVMSCDAVITCGVHTPRV